MKYLSKILKSEIFDLLNIFGYYDLRFTKDERKTLAEAKKTVKASNDYEKKFGLTVRSIGDYE